MIFKIQRPISAEVSGSDDEVLIYNEDRSIEFMIPMSLMERFWLDVGAYLKVYVEAEIDEDEGFVIDSIVEEQPW